ncbi:MAG: DUF455 family protein, partial [SAR324 cluster bacterium]|nr:DUF455 family protein [SAR324 cluster bacterium]
MNLQEFAESILFSSTLSEKMIQPSSFEDVPSCASVIPIPDFPNRPPQLSLDKWHKAKRVTFPRVESLEQERQRGVMLHFFANHELLALELMALALLKFPKAPAEFRMGLAHTILEEQDHMLLYQQRMEDFGIEFGEIPVNDFFWKCVAHMQTPFDFVVRISLTLEQANLDYALYYAQVFERLDDKKTVSILGKVYDDEVGHVQHGLQWFRYWKHPDLSEWEAYKTALNHPLSPARAKGIGYSKEARRFAGFSENYISELALYSQSKGRSPDVYFFNPTCEKQIVLGDATPSKMIRHLMTDLTALPMFFCKTDDVVLVEKTPSTGFLSKLQQIGFFIPEFVELETPPQSQRLSKLEISQRKIGSLQPWGWSPTVMNFLEPLLENLAANSKSISPTSWTSSFQQLFSKAWSAQLLRNYLEEVPCHEHWSCDVQVAGRVCCTLEEIKKQVDALWESGFPHIVIKAAYGSSGQDMIHLQNSKGWKKKYKWIRNILIKQQSVVVEPWLDKVMDLSLHFELYSDGKISISGITQFFTDSRGQYNGSVVGRFDAGLEKVLLQFLHYRPVRSQPKLLTQLFEDIASYLAPRLTRSGYAGPVGIDALVYRNRHQSGNHFCLKPIVEINPRFSMGRLSLELVKHLNHQRVGLWFILNKKCIIDAGYENIVEFTKTLEQQYPLSVVSSAGNKIDSGALFTTDPGQAQAFVTVLLTGRSIDECRECFNSILGLHH